jgi:hypothetical protein
MGIEEQQRKLDFINGEGLEVPADATPLDFLFAVYRSAAQPMSRRLKAACEAAAYCHPKLAVTAMVGSDDLADRLDRAILRSNGAAPQTIDHAPQRELPPTGPRPTPLGAPFPMERHRRA